MKSTKTLENETKHLESKTDKGRKENNFASCTGKNNTPFYSYLVNSSPPCTINAMHFNLCKKHFVHCTLAFLSSHVVAKQKLLLGLLSLPVRKKATMHAPADRQNPYNIPQTSLFNSRKREENVSQDVNCWNMLSCSTHAREGREGSQRTLSCTEFIPPGLLYTGCWRISGSRIKASHYVYHCGHLQAGVTLWHAELPPMQVARDWCYSHQSNNAGRKQKSLPKTLRTDYLDYCQSE